MGIPDYTCRHRTNIYPVPDTPIDSPCERCLRLRRDAQLFEVSKIFGPAIERADRAVRDFNSGSLDQFVELNGRALDLKLERRKAEQMVHRWHEKREARRREMVETLC
jgi:hypothetical protein